MPVQYANQQPAWLDHYIITLTGHHDDWIVDIPW